MCVCVSVCVSVFVIVDIVLLRAFAYVLFYIFKFTLNCMGCYQHKLVQYTHALTHSLFSVSRHCLALVQKKFRHLL